MPEKKEPVYKKESYEIIGACIEVYLVFSLVLVIFPCYSRY